MSKIEQLQQPERCNNGVSSANQCFMPAVVRVNTLALCVDHAAMFATAVTVAMADIYPKAYAYTVARLRETISVDDAESQARLVIEALHDAGLLTSEQ